MRELSIRLLGGFEVEVDGVKVPAGAWERRRGADLVKLLALAPGQRLDRDRVIEMLWPHLDAAAGAANLHKAATIARKALGAREAVVLRGGQVALAPAATVLTDVERFESERDPERYGGELLPDDRYEEWAQAPRERVHETHLAVLRERGAWEELAAEEPGDEGAQRELMRSLAERGNRHGALRQFRRLADALALVGLRPAPETTALHDEIARRSSVAAPLAGGLPLAGRETELRMLNGALERAGSGRGGALLLRGEAGVGKTRLAEELLAAAAERGWTTLRGAGSKQSGGPYGAVAGALDRMLAERPDLSAALPDSARAEIARICPAVRAEPGRIDPRSDRSRIFSAVGRLLVAVAREGGAVIFIDDLDHADAGTIELCASLAATAAFEPLLVVLAHRGDARAAALARVRGELVERGLAFDLDLDPLDRDEAGRLIDLAASSPLAPVTRDGILARGEGLPFFLIELASAVGPDGALAVPDRLYEVVNARLGRLEGTVHRSLSLVAALGDSFTADELIAVTASAEEDAFAVLDAALESGIVDEDAGAYRFRHALLREALARGLPAHRRFAAHRDAARRLADSGAAPARVAEHLLAAGLEEEAVPWLTDAARRAASVAAYADARRLVELALPHAGPERRAELLPLRADLLLTIGDAEAPVAYAAALAEPGPRSEIELQVSQARALMMLGDITGATAAISDLEASSLTDRARLVFVRGMLAWFRGDLDEARRCAEEARPLALEARLPMEIEQSTQLHSAVAHSLGDWPGGLRSDLKATLRLPELVGTFFDAHHCSAEYELASAPTVSLRDEAESLRGDAGRAGASRVEAFSAVVAGEAELAAGDVAAAERRLRDAAALARATGATASESLARMRLGEAALAGGERDDASRLLAEATELARASSIPHHLLYHAFAARLRAAPDRRLAAELSEAESLLAGAATCAFCPLPFDVAAAGALADGGSPDRAAPYLARAEAAVPLWPPGSWPAALVAEARARVAAARGDTESAGELFGTAVEGFELAGRPLDRAAAAERLAELGRGRAHSG